MINRTRTLPIVLAATVAGALALPTLAGAADPVAGIALCVDHRGSVRYPGETGSCGARETVLEVGAPDSPAEVLARLERLERAVSFHSRALGMSLDPILSVQWVGVDPESARHIVSVGGRHLDPGSDVVLSYLDAEGTRNQRTIGVVAADGSFSWDGLPHCGWTDMHFDASSVIDGAPVAGTVLDEPDYDRCP